MAVTKRNYPNDYYSWFNDDNRVAILERVTTTDSSQTHNETWDTFQSSGDLSGNITATSTVAGSFVDMTSASHGLAVNDRVTISGTTTYDDNHAVTVVGDANTFRIAATNSTSNEGASSGVTWISLFIDDGLRITYHSKYEEIVAGSLTSELSPVHGVDSGMQQALVCYMKARLYEDQGDMQKAQYFRAMYNKQIKQYPSRKSGVRQLAVPRL